MASLQFPLPGALIELIERGVWPRAVESATTHPPSVPLITEAQVRRYAPDEFQIYLEPPPFTSFADELERCERGFWKRYGALEQIEPSSSRCLIIGGFGLGSDAPIVLAFDCDPHDPPVLRLRWDRTGTTQWVEGARSFSEFSALIGLEKR